MLAWPVSRTGSLVLAPPGVVLSWVPSGSQDAARQDWYPASNYNGGVAFAGLGEPGYLQRTTNGLYVEDPQRLPDLASIIRRVLIGR